MLEHLADALRALHIVAGATALLTFAVPLVVAKGNAVHRRVGWIYTAAMYAAAATAVAIAPVRMVQRPVGEWRSSLFLAFVAVMSFSAARHGTRLLRRDGVVSLFDRALPVALAVASVALLAYGIVARFTLAAAFAPLGLLVASAPWRAHRRPLAPKERVPAHLTSMIISCIATLTAFLVTNARSFGQGSNVWVWLSPTLIGVPLMTVWRRRYEKKGPVLPPR